MNTPSSAPGSTTGIARSGWMRFSRIATIAISLLSPTRDAHSSAIASERHAEQICHLHDELEAIGSMEESISVEFMEKLKQGKFMSTQEICGNIIDYLQSIYPEEKIEVVDFRYDLERRLGKIIFGHAKIKIGDKVHAIALSKPLVGVDEENLAWIVNYANQKGHMVIEIFLECVHSELLKLGGARVSTDTMDATLEKALDFCSNNLKSYGAEIKNLKAEPSGNGFKVSMTLIMGKIACNIELDGVTPPQNETH